MSVHSHTHTINPNFLPNLPGFRPKPVKTTNGKKSYFMKMDGNVILKDEIVPTDNDDFSINSSVAQSTVMKARKAVANQTQHVILHFSAYFTEMVEGLSEPQVRNCSIYFYVEDGTIKVVEKPQVNSGVTQGTLVRRAVIMKHDNTPYVEEDFVVGECITIYGRYFNIVGCDNATREYMKTQFGIEQSEPVAAPNDPYTTYRKSMEAGPADTWGKFHAKKNENKTFNEALLGHGVDNGGREGFIKYGQQQLKFRCIWDDTGHLYGDVIEFTLSYYIADDTLDIVSIPNTSTKDSNRTKLLKRSKLPKNFHDTMALGSRPPQQNFFHWSDLYIGLELEVYGRTIRLIDADNATREYYHQHEMPLGAPLVLPQPEVVVHEREIPPPTGFGSEEDSLRSITGSLMPGPPPMKKLGENKMLSFLASLSSGGIDDVDRRFVITYYVQDNTIKILEPPVRNSGFNGGVFLSRRPVKHANGELIMEKDLYVGMSLRVLKHEFLLLDTSDTTLRWMEDKGFPQSNFYLILNKMRPKMISAALDGSLTQLFRDHESPETGVNHASIETLRKVCGRFGLIGVAGGLSEHEIRRIVRGNGNKTDNFDYTKIIEQLIKPTEEFKV